MDIFLEKDYNTLSTAAAKHLLTLARKKQTPLLCVASGDSPAGLYREIIVQKNGTETDSWNFVGLDEWQGMNASDEGSCQWHLHQQLFLPLNVEASRICFFDGRAASLEEECQRVDQFIADHDGIDIAVIGLGSNGHIGMNEPQRNPTLTAHIAELDTSTIKTAQKYFSTETIITGGLTLGIASILSAKHIFLIVSGTHKAAIIKQLMESEPTPALPVTWLKNHPNVYLYLDEAAASEWKK
ncbi:glucosamine-6-phosphate deaminase [Flavihumibacter sp. RY-1]|uniref:Glucosamine-6-phosphate deaminase n=1 Tax=Flavihumibacter fluminis TaxID=2909236 RepID=A0ABS9BGD2_9BACT|nr:glucosamine-6-phosphate deaminase [Flavihumibacter fluminis]MCF1714198.1 glucosamine-6-phosphate deaminase [Flavihumibacter fluminis]